MSSSAVCAQTPATRAGSKPPPSASPFSAARLTGMEPRLNLPGTFSIRLSYLFLEAELRRILAYESHRRAWHHRPNRRRLRRAVSRLDSGSRRTGGGMDEVLYGFGSRAGPG